MDLWRELVGSSWAREFVAGGVGGTAGVLAGYPLDTLRIRQQHSFRGSAFTILRHTVAKEGPCTLYRGMMAPLATITFQNAIVFQTYAIFSRALDTNLRAKDPPSLTAVALGGTITGTIQSFFVSPVELVKIRLQLQQRTRTHRGPLNVARSIIQTQGWKGIFCGLGVTILRDAPSHGVYFWTYEYMKEQLHPGCRTSGEESTRTMLLAGGLAGVTSWISCYHFDVIKTKIQAESNTTYSGIMDCFSRNVAREGYCMLWRGLGTTISRAFFVNGVVFTAYETTMRCMNSKKG